MLKTSYESITDSKAILVIFQEEEAVERTLFL